jgi:hypothetical protein
LCILKDTGPSIKYVLYLFADARQGQVFFSLTTSGKNNLGLTQLDGSQELFLLEKSERIVKLTTLLCIVRRSRMCGVLYPRHLHAVALRHKDNFTCAFTFRLQRRGMWFSHNTWLMGFLTSVSAQLAARTFGMVEGAIHFLTLQIHITDFCVVETLVKGNFNLQPLTNVSLIKLYRCINPLGVEAYEIRILYFVTILKTTNQHA